MPILLQLPYPEFTLITLLAAKPELTSRQNIIDFVNKITGKRLVGNPVYGCVFPVKFYLAWENFIRIAVKPRGLARGYKAAIR